MTLMQNPTHASTVSDMMTQRLSSTLAAMPFSGGLDTLPEMLIIAW